MYVRTYMYSILHFDNSVVHYMYVSMHIPCEVDVDKLNVFCEYCTYVRTYVYG